MRLLTVIILFVGLPVWAKVLKYEVLGSKKESFSYRQACEKMGHRHLLLVEMVGEKIDCMGRQISPGEFCKSIFLTDPQYIRGYWDKQAGQITCQKGTNVALSVTCSGKIKPLCEDPRAACLVLKETFAKNLSLIHQTKIFEQKSGEVLSCHYSLQTL